MYEEKELGMEDEISVMFADDIEILEDRLTDIILALGLPEGQTNAVLRLMSDAIEQHHADILDTLEDSLDDEDTTELSE